MRLASLLYIHIYYTYSPRYQVGVGLDWDWEWGRVCVCVDGVSKSAESLLFLYIKWLLEMRNFCRVI